MGTGPLQGTVRLANDFAAFCSLCQPITLEAVRDAKLLHPLLHKYAWNGAAMLSEISGQPQSLPPLRDIPGLELEPLLFFDSEEAAKPVQTSSLGVLIPRSWREANGIEMLPVTVVGE